LIEKRPYPPHGHPSIDITAHRNRRHYSINKIDLNQQQIYPPELRRRYPESSRGEAVWIFFPSVEWHGISLPVLVMAIINLRSVIKLNTIAKLKIKLHAIVEMILLSAVLVGGVSWVEGWFSTIPTL